MANLPCIITQVMFPWHLERLWRLLDSDGDGIFTEEELRLIDTHGDSKLSKAELRVALRLLGLSAAECQDVLLEHVMIAGDKTFNPHLTFEEINYINSF